MLMIVLFLLLSPAANAQGEAITGKLQHGRVLSKSKKPYSYAELFSKYQIVIFARVGDCSTCLSADAPWIQMIRTKLIATCFVFADRSLRVARYYHEINSLPFDFYCDTGADASQLLGEMETPVILVLNREGREVFFANPLKEMQKLSSVLGPDGFNKSR